MQLTSYVLSLMATALGLVAPFGKKMKTILIFNLISNLLVGTSYLMVFQKSGALIFFTASVQVLINYSFEARNKKLPLWLVGLHAAVFLALNLFTFSAWYDIFAFVAAMLFVLCVAQSNAKHYRILGVLNSFVWIAYDIFAKAYGNLFVHIILLASNWVAILLRDKKKTKSL